LLKSEEWAVFVLPCISEGVGIFSLAAGNSNGHGSNAAFSVEGWMFLLAAALNWAMVEPDQGSKAVLRHFS
jgi:hypothetical protein